MILKNRTLAIQAKEAILQIIKTEPEFMTKLPSEKELSLKLAVSRNTVREAIQMLSNEGIVLSRQGIGTFVINNSRNIKSNIRELDSFTKIIKSHGHVPGTRSLSIKKTYPNKNIASKLNISTSTPILYIDRVRLADEKPVIYVEDYIVYVDGMYERFNKEKNESLFNFLKSNGHKISFSSCNIYAVISNERLKNKLSLTESKPLLHLEQIHYTTEGSAILYSDSYFISDNFDFNLIRKSVD